MTERPALLRHPEIAVRSGPRPAVIARCRAAVAYGFMTRTKPSRASWAVLSDTPTTEVAMTKPRIRHIALNVQDLDQVADYYKKIFGLEEKYRGPNGTIYLSDGHVGIALISRADMPWGINHFGFQVESVPAVVEAAGTTAEANTFGAVAESWIRDPEGNRVDVAEHGWPI